LVEYSLLSSIKGVGIAQAPPFMQHALDVIAERQLDLLWVERTVFEPQWQEADPGDPDVLRRFRMIPMPTPPTFACRPSAGGRK
jgi:hypothetical protein